MSIVFRKCTCSDLTELKDFSRKTYFETFSDMNTPENMAAYLDKAFDEERLRFELSDPNSSFYFLYLDNTLAGYLKLNESIAQTDVHDAESLEIERIYIDKKFQKKAWDNT